MVTPSRNKLNYDDADAKIAAFDEWLELQIQPVKDTVDHHIYLLTKAIPNFGDKSAKILLAEVYLVTRQEIHIDKKYGEREK